MVVEVKYHLLVGAYLGGPLRPIFHVSSSELAVENLPKVKFLSPFESLSLGRSQSLFITYMVRSGSLEIISTHLGP